VGFMRLTAHPKLLGPSKSEVNMEKKEPLPNPSRKTSVKVTYPVDEERILFPEPSQEALDAFQEYVRSCLKQSKNNTSPQK